MTYRKKLIEVALPLDAINRESAREKSIRHGHPSTMHLWWARRPLAACRAVLFASLVDDPGNDLPEEEAAKERERLFHIIEELVKWENTTNETVLEAARVEIRRSTNGKPPPVLDPFCGGGSIPLEAQRLGLDAYASDLNPIAVLITKALIEIPPKFVGIPPVNPDSKKGTGSTAAWRGASGLAADVHYYGKWMRDEAWKRIGHLYPKGPNGETVIAWLWARTVKCPSPACGAQMPLVRSFWLSSKKGGETWVQPIVDKQIKAVRFQIQAGKGTPPSGTVGRQGARCIICGSPVTFVYIREYGKRHGLGIMPLAIVTEGKRSRTYIAVHEDVACIKREHSWLDDINLPYNPRDFKTPNYGLTTFADLFTARQLTTLTIFCDLVHEARKLALEHSGNNDEYANAIATYLAFAVDRLVDRSSTLCSWTITRENVRSTFGRQALPMVWDYAECNPFSESTGNWTGAIGWVVEAIQMLPSSNNLANIGQLDIASALMEVECPIICTDPPYYDNIVYADLSDFFYVWLRRCLGHVYPNLFSMMLTPKQQELVANPYRFEGNREKAKEHFEVGLGKAFVLIRNRIHSEYPLTLFYAFKQEEEMDSGTVEGLISSTGWETMLKGLLDAGFQITATWPMRTEMKMRQIAMNKNALASSIVVACRPRPQDAPIATRREFLSALKEELPNEIRIMMNGRVAPVDLAQAVIGPGMAIFSRYSKVLEAEGSPMAVRKALQEVNYFAYDFLAQQEGDLDEWSQFCVAWFQQYGTREGQFGEADVLARAKVISVDGLVRMGLVDASKGKVRLILREGYEEGWDPRTQLHITTWEVCQRLVWTLNNSTEQEVGRLVGRMVGKAEQAKDLAYHLYSIADRKGWAEEARGYNYLVASWPEIQKAAAAAAEESQGRLT